jgi:hypothetical protein
MSEATAHYIGTIFVLLVVYQIKHFLADYTFQLNSRYMLGKFKPGLKFVGPLLAHVAVHGAFTFVIVFLFKFFMIMNGAPLHFYFPLYVDVPRALLSLSIYSGKLALFDMVVHFIMDRIKASPKLLGRYHAISKQEYEDYQQSVSPDMRASKHPECVNFVKNQDEAFKKKFKNNVNFWLSLGLDQGVHHLTHYAIIFYLVTR